MCKCCGAIEFWKESEKDKNSKLFAKIAIYTWKEGKRRIKGKEYFNYTTRAYDLKYCPSCRKEAGRMKKLTVKMIKEAIKDLPDETECELWSDTGLDQCVYEEDVVPVLEECFVVKDNLIIYGNWRNIDKEDKQ